MIASSLHSLISEYISVPKLVRVATQTERYTSNMCAGKKLFIFADMRCLMSRFKFHNKRLSEKFSLLFLPLRILLVLRLC